MEKNNNLIFKYIVVIKLKINQICFRGSSSLPEQGEWTGFIQVLENQESPGILLWHFSALGSLGKRPLVLESSGNNWFLKTGMGNVWMTL